MNQPPNRPLVKVDGCVVLLLVAAWTLAVFTAGWIIGQAW